MCNYPTCGERVEERVGRETEVPRTVSIAASAYMHIDECNGSDDCDDGNDEDDDDDLNLTDFLASQYVILLVQQQQKKLAEHHKYDWDMETSTAKT
jgi:hypothetical protein